MFNLDETETTRTRTHDEMLEDVNNACERYMASKSADERDANRVSMVVVNTAVLQEIATCWPDLDG